ncbi:MAG: CBS domain-containing protein [Nanoarchaeota archaeon]|nr:CBS domain-containing protein [Nanoarchaeota archaeon]
MDLREIKEIRRQLGLTQAQLAEQAQVSQSLIAKIESGKLDPAYTNATKIFDALRRLSTRTEQTACAVMHSAIVSISPQATVKEAIEKLRKHGFSQLPVIDAHKVVGMISESSILAALLDGKKGKVEEVMSAAPPTVDADSPLSSFSPLLQHFQLVLVSRTGKPIGIITKSDLLGALYRR